MNRFGARAATVLAGLVLAECAGDRPHGTGTEITRFDDLLQWVPPDMESLLLADAVPGLPTFGAYSTEAAIGDSGDDASGPEVRTVHAGRRFRPRGISFGDAEVVVVTRYRHGLPRWNSAPSEKGRIESVRGHRAVFEPGGAEGPLETWEVALGPDTLLHATRRDLLERALAGGHPPLSSRLAARGWSAHMDTRAPVVLLREFDRDEVPAAGSPSGRQTQIVALPSASFRGFVLTIDRPGADGATRWRVRARTDDGGEAEAWLARHGLGTPTREQPQHDPAGASFEGTFGSGERAPRTELAVVGLFGCNIAI